MSIHADDEFNLRLALMSELDDVTPRHGLADLVIARYRKSRRRRFAGVFGLFVVFAGIGVPLGVAGTAGGTAARSAPVGYSPKDAGKIARAAVGRKRGATSWRAVSRSVLPGTSLHRPPPGVDTFCRRVLK